MELRTSVDWDANYSLVRMSTYSKVKGTDVWQRLNPLSELLFAKTRNRKLLQHF